MSDRPEPPSTIYVIDDDPMMREALDSLLRSFGFKVRCFASTREFRIYRRDSALACLVLDVQMPKEDGLQFQKYLIGCGDILPIIFLTGHGDVPMAVQAMRYGAIEFLLKPFKAEDLLRATKAAFARQSNCYRVAPLTHEERKKYSRLSPRERKIVSSIVAGKLNKQIAIELGLKEITVKVCRSNIMKTLEIDKTAALISLFHRLEFQSHQMHFDVIGS